MAGRRRKTTTATTTATRRRRRTTAANRKTTRRKSSVKIKIKQSSLYQVWAVFCLGLAIFLYLSLTYQAGPIGNIIAYNVQALFGTGVFLLPVALGIISFIFFFTKQSKFQAAKIISVAVAVSSFLGLIHLQAPTYASLENIELYGGYIGFVSSFLLQHFFERAAAALILGMIFVSSVIIIFDLNLTKIIQFFSSDVIGKIRLPEISIESAKTKEKKEEKKELKEKEDANNSFEILKIVKPKSLERVKKRQRKEPIPVTEDNLELPFEQESTPMELMQNVNGPQDVESQQDSESDEEKLKKDNERYADWKLPSLDLLDDSRSELEIDEKILRKQAAVIREKLQQFGIDVGMKDINVGPTVTQYTLEPSEGIKLNKITSLKNDLALALAAKAIRIEAPIPGKALVGIELPNEKRMTVHLRELIESKDFSDVESNLRLVLGRDVSGRPIIADLRTMPHLLIAGRTGSGKSVCMNTFLLSLLYQNSPRDLRFIMIDPKMVELGFYNGISHLLTPVITETEKAVSALRWAVSEMNRRYRVLNEKRYRNILEYNEEEEDKMSTIVIVIDELADMMMRGAKKETEALICRLAQMARAVGMHLIIATQRPSVDVITGIIKANIPTRIAFSVTAGVDSRTVIDNYGAEDLLGQGDMLYLPGGMSGPIRIQGVWVSTKEIERVTNNIKLTMDPEYDDDIIGSGSNQAGSVGAMGSAMGGFGGSSNDDKYDEAVETVRKTGRASATLLQRYLGIGYARAAKILDEMEENGLIGPSRGAKPREIFITAGDTEQQNTAVVS